MDIDYYPNANTQGSRKEMTGTDFCSLWDLFPKNEDIDNKYSLIVCCAPPYREKTDKEVKRMLRRAKLRQRNKRYSNKSCLNEGIWYRIRVNIKTEFQ